MSTYHHQQQQPYHHDGRAHSGLTNHGMVSYPTAQMYQAANSCTASTPPPVPTAISDPVTKAVVDNIMGNLPTKKNQVIYRCDICEQEFSGQVVLETHIAGSKHAKKLKSLEILNQLTASGQNFSKTGPGGILRCEACGVEANSSQQLQTHLAGNKHKQKMLKIGNKLPPPSESPTSLTGIVSKTTMPPSLQAPAEGEITPSPVPAPMTACQGDQGAVQALPTTPQGSKFFCQLCNVTLNSTIQMQQHMESRKHKDRELGKPQPKHSAKPYQRRPTPARFSQPRGASKKKGPTTFLTPLSSSFVPGSTL